MKILYIANIRLPTEKAHGIQIMKTCEAFAELGHEVELVVPWRFNFIKKDPFEYYGTRKSFKITKLPSLDALFFTSGRLGFWIQSISFFVSAFYYSVFKKKNIVYSRDELLIFLLIFFEKNLFWESHTGRFNFIIKKVLKKSAGLVVITKGLQDFYTKNGATLSKVLIAPDGVDTSEFSVELSKEECRRRFNFPQDKKIIMYTGHLYSWKGVDVLLEVAGILKDDLFVFVGGTKVDVENFKLKAEKLNFKNILILGHKPHREIPYYLKSADVLVLPNRSDNEISSKYTSPMKLFEYMAAGVPIIASNLPSTREVADGVVFFVTPDDSKALADGIVQVCVNDDIMRAMVARALKRSRDFDWKRRAFSIVTFYKIINHTL